MPTKPIGNDFQNIGKGRKRFDEFLFDPFAELDAKELAMLSLNIQKRHLIGHNLGLVDAKFAQHAKLRVTGVGSMSPAWSSSGSGRVRRRVSCS